ncbi:MAG: MbeCy [Erysipelotrichaceae bacterium]|nr:MbeCy [Erysipelotrichaceae bacterium]
MKREKEVKVRFFNEELKQLDDYVKLSGYPSRESYMRAVLLNNKPTELPPIEYKKLINSFNAVGNNLNQLVKLAYKRPLIERDATIVLNQLKELIASTEATIGGNHHGNNSPMGS